MSNDINALAYQIAQKVIAEGKSNYRQAYILSDGTYEVTVTKKPTEIRNNEHIRTDSAPLSLLSSGRCDYCGK